jgi:hypothetical protein
LLGLGEKKKEGKKGKLGEGKAGQGEGGPKVRRGKEESNFVQNNPDLPTWFFYIIS